VVASDVVGAAHELVTDGVSGRIFAAGNCDSLRRALEDITHPEHTETYRQQSTIALARYLNEVNPVAEIRRALTMARVFDCSTP
jgi:hypothetical protein